MRGASPDEAQPGLHSKPMDAAIERVLALMRGALPDEAQPGLHSKPMDAAIGRVLASHCRGGCHGRRF